MDIAQTITDRIIAELESALRPGLNRGMKAPKRITRSQALYIVA